MFAIVAILAISIILPLIIFAAFLRLFARWRRVEAFSRRRALAVVVVISIVNSSIALALAWLFEQRALAEDTQLFLLAIAIALQLAVALVVVHAMLDVGWRKAMVVGWGSMIAAGVVSVALGYVLRTTVVEAFAVPTGGMAPTILGRHVDLSCANCGYAWPAALPPDGFEERERLTMRRCPQCAYELAPASSLQAKNGERIFLYKASFPRRWQMAVFDTPKEPSEKFIKRLVGMPGETIEIAGGDLIVSGKRLRKEPNAQEDLWFLVHDSAFAPAETFPNTRRWTSENGTDIWQQGNGTWVFQNDGDREDEIWFNGAIDTSLSYNFGDWFEPQRVNDMRLDCYFNRFTGNGSVTLRWEFGETSIEATCLANGRLTLTTQLPTTADAKHVETVETTGFRSDSQQPLRFTVRDGIACLSQAEDELARIEFDNRNAAELAEAVRSSRIGSQLLPKTVLSKFDDSSYIEMCITPRWGNSATTRSESPASHWATTNIFCLVTIATPHSIAVFSVRSSKLRSTASSSAAIGRRNDGIRLIDGSLLMYHPTISIRAMLCVVACIGLACVALARANSIWATVMFSAALAVISLGVLAAILRRGAKQAYWIGFALFGWLYLWMAHWPSEFATEPRLQIDANGTLASTRLLVYFYNDWLPKIRETPAATQAPPYTPGSGGYGTGMPNAVGGGYGSDSRYGGTSGLGGLGPGGVVVGPGAGGGGFGGPGAGGYGGGGGGTLTIAPVAPPPTVPVPVAISYPLMHEFMRVGHSLFTIILAFAGGALAAYLYQTRDRGSV